MRRTAIVAALGLFTLAAAPAAADGTTVMTGQVTYVDASVLAGHCHMVAFAQETATGGQDTYTGVAVGVVVGYTPLATLEPVDVRCFVRINGHDAAGTTGGALVPGVDETVGQVTFTASETDSVELCMVFGLSRGIGPVCEPTTRDQVPPQTVQDLLFIVHVADFLLCPILASLAPGVTGVLDITADGDVAVLGENVHDCPPYEVWRHVTNGTRPPGK